MRTFRLANGLSEAVRAGERFEIKPLIRAVTFPNAAFVLALAQGSVRLLEITASMPTFGVRVPGLPSDAASAAGKASITDRSPSGRLQGSEGQKVYMRQYARKIDAALRDVLAGRDLPLILACAPPLDAIFRSVCSYPQLASEGIEGNPEGMPDDDLTARAREVLDRIYAHDLRAAHELFDTRGSQGRAATEIGDVARAATVGAVDALIVDIDDAGTIQRTDDEDGESPGVTDALVRRTLQHRGRVLAVRSEDVPGPGPAAAILRYPA
jgi:Bacterial archaeo-eukaryotic release factor family 11